MTVIQSSISDFLHNLLQGLIPTIIIIFFVSIIILFFIFIGYIIAKKVFNIDIFKLEEEEEPDRCPHCHKVI